MGKYVIYKRLNEQRRHSTYVIFLCTALSFALSLVMQTHCLRKIFRKAVIDNTFEKTTC
jgi:hypothetical protein